MIKIEKNLVIIPASLQVRPVNASSKKTHDTRHSLLLLGAYPKKSSTIDKRYKMEDIKSTLFAIYNGKCAFCEQRVERWQVEHFRPKSVYYWLAFSWDNLLYACPVCNGEKSFHFKIKGTLAQLPADLDEINSLSALYDSTEQPFFINPEREDPEPMLVFQQNGMIASNDERMQYTINTCKIDRKYLNDYRQKIWNDFLNDVKSETLEGKNEAEIKAAIMVLIRKFVNDSKITSNEFIAFRRYAIKHFLTAALKNILP